MIKLETTFMKLIYQLNTSKLCMHIHRYTVYLNASTNLLYDGACWWFFTSHTYIFCASYFHHHKFVSEVQCA